MPSPRLNDIMSRLPQALAGGLEAIFTILGRPATTLRQSPLAMTNKWKELVIAPNNVFWGLYFCTRAMTVGITPEFRQKVIDLIRTSWHQKRKSFTVSEAEKLAGLLGWLGQGARWIFHLMVHVYSSIAFALRSNTAFLVGSSSTFRALIKNFKTRPFAKTDEDIREINFAIKTAARMTH